LLRAALPRRIPSVSRMDFWRRDDLVPFRAAWGQAGSTETEVTPRRPILLTPAIICRTILPFMSGCNKI